MEQTLAASANIAAKHEGGDPEVEQTLAHQSNILDYFREKEEVIKCGDWDNLQNNFLEKVAACNHSAWALTEKGLSFITGLICKSAKGFIE